MVSKRLAFTMSASSAAGALIALCIATSCAPAEASALGVSEVDASRVSPAFSGDAYTKEMGNTGAGGGAPMEPPSKVDPVHALPEISGEALTFESQTRPHADGIIAILIAAIGMNDDRRGQNDEALAVPAPAPLTAPLGSTKGSFIDGSVVYGSDLRIPTGHSILPYIEQDN
jgi:hypothetical protein